MRVLVTGHHGYIGSVTAPALVKAGHDVVGIDTFLYEGCDFCPQVGAVQTRRLDVRDIEPGELQGFDAIVHLAGLSNDPLGELDPMLTERINATATIRLAKAAREAGVRRFVFASSCSMYGAADLERPVDETAPLRPLTAYARSKASVEEAVVELADDDFSPVFMRNATVYGVSPRLRLDLVVNNLTAWAFTTGTVRILSDGTPWRPLVHVRDIAATTVALLEAPRKLVHAEAFNVGRQGENYQVRDLAEIAADVVAGSSVEIAGGGDPDARSYQVDFGKLARTFPALKLSWTVAAGTRELVDAYAERGLSRAQFEGGRYTRLSRLRALIDAGALDAELRLADTSMPQPVA
jgi:nucleoside-diphosphate-sugar epimerase